MFNKKRWSLMSVVCLLVMSLLLAACGGNNAGNSVTTTNNTNNSDGAEQGQNSGKEEAKEKPVLKLLRTHAAINYNDYPVNTYLEEATGYQMEHDVLPQENPSDKLNLIMASGSEYDLVDAADKRDFFTFAQNGALMDLTELIDQYGPNIKNAITPESFAAASFEGKIYGIPTQNVSYIRDGLLIRSDWLAKTGLSEPTTVDEFTAMLQAFKEDPAGNGNQNIPFTMANAPLISNLTGAYGIYGFWTPMDGQLVNVVHHPELKDYITYMRSLYEQGLLDTEFATNKSATAGEKFTSGRAGVLLSNWSSIPSYDEALKKNVPDASYKFLNPLTGPDGKKGFVRVGGMNKITFVPSTAEHPEDAIKMIDAMLDPEVFKEMYIGTEGETYKVEDGAYVPIEPAFFDERGYSNNFVIGMDESNFVTYWQARLRKSQAMYDNFQILNNVPDSEVVMDPLAFAPFLPTYSEKSTQLENIVNDHLIKMIVDGVTDEAIAEMQAAWKDAGGEDVAKEVNDWYVAQ